MQRVRRIRSKCLTRFSVCKAWTVNEKENDCTSEAIKGETGKLLTNPEEIRNKWTVYIETLYDKNGKPHNEEMGIELELVVDED